MEQFIIHKNLSILVTALYFKGFLRIMNFNSFLLLNLRNFCKHFGEKGSTLIYASEYFKSHCVDRCINTILHNRYLVQ